MNQTVPRCPHCCPDDTAQNAKDADGRRESRHTTDCASSGDSPPSFGTRLPRCSASIVDSNIGDPRGGEGSRVFGVMKPDIVFFGEGLPEEFHASLQEDVHRADLVVVIGSSLKVRPVSHIPGEKYPNVIQSIIFRCSNGVRSVNGCCLV